MTETTYNFSFPTNSAIDSTLADAYTEGTLEEAIELATTYDVKVTLTNEPGFPCGWVNSDGTYTVL